MGLKHPVPRLGTYRSHAGSISWQPHTHAITTTRQHRLCTVHQFLADLLTADEWIGSKQALR